jgi:type I site-specific restriction-modification system R (restriction) subunit
MPEMPKNQVKIEAIRGCPKSPPSHFLPRLSSLQKMAEAAPRDGVPVDYRVRDEVKHDRVRLIDFHELEKNEFLVVDQFAIKGPKHVRRPDILVFINGLPLAVIELKNPADEHADIWKAYQQLQTYKEEIPDLFNTNAALVISDGFTARIGSLTANEERFMPWRTIKNENDKPVLEFSFYLRRTATGSLRRSPVTTSSTSCGKRCG